MLQRGIGLFDFFKLHITSSSFKLHFFQVTVNLYRYTSFLAPRVSRPARLPSSLIAYSPGLILCLHSLHSGSKQKRKP